MIIVELKWNNIPIFENNYLCLNIYNNQLLKDNKVTLIINILFLSAKKI